MSSSVFTALLDEKIHAFISSFEQTAYHAFYDPRAEKLRHTGEFGGFREIIVKDFLRFFTPGRLAIHNGFVITAMDDVSTQCDVVIYDASNTPLIESGERQRFFPVESVCAVGEVKSVLSKADLRSALNKLARTKALKENVPSPVVVRRERDGQFDPANYPYDQLPAFLICQRFDFQTKGLVEELAAMYESDVEIRHRHNLILSISDGLLAYVDRNGKTLMFPEMAGRIEGKKLSPKEVLPNRFVVPDSDQLSPIRTFCSYLFLLSSSATVLYPDVTSYMDAGSRTLIDGAQA